MPRIAYLYSRYPVVSQTFCDSEMLALEAMGFDLEIVSLNAPPDSFRHERLDRLRGEVHYPAPSDVIQGRAKSPEFDRLLGPLIATHDKAYGKSYKAGVRARNAWHFAPLLRRLGVTHVHIHFANRATHSALFLKQLGFTYSFTAHAQDFMVDLGSDDLLREMIREASFVVAVSDFSRSLLVKVAPDHEEKIHRIYNGIELDDFPTAVQSNEAPLKLFSVGRLIEFKGFQHLIGAVGLLKERGLQVQTRIVGEGPMRTELEAQIKAAGLEQEVTLLGVRSQEQIKSELANAHVFVLPSIVDRKGASDILPTVITEALACRLPVVSTRVAGIPEMVVHDKSGFLVPPEDESGLADSLQDLYGQAQLRTFMGLEGRAHAERLFSLSGTAGLLAGYLEQAAASTAPAVREEQAFAYVIPDEAPLATWQEIPAEVRLLTSGVTAATDTRMEYFPDATVLESHWLRRHDWRQRLEKLRSTVGDAVSGEEFYTQARRACWMAEALPKRGVKHLHAHQTASVLSVWFWKKLTGLSISAAVEEAPALSRTTLGKLLHDFDRVSVSDPKMLTEASGTYQDWLRWLKPPTHEQLKIGPLKLKRKVAPPVEDRKALEAAWLKELKNIHA